MEFFGLPAEVRMQIYSYLLTTPDRICLVVHYCFMEHFQCIPSYAGYNLRRETFRTKQVPLYPEVLRVNKQLHSEAQSMLYLTNRFQFPTIHLAANTCLPNVAPFLHQIGVQARFLRSICIRFPVITEGRDKVSRRTTERYIEILENIGRTCTRISTIELIGPSHPDLVDMAIQLSALDAINEQFKTMPSLKRIIVEHPISAREAPNKDLSEALDNKIKETLESELIMKFTSLKWIVKFKKLWISRDDDTQFESEEDYNQHVEARDKRRLAFYKMHCGNRKSKSSKR